MKKFIRFFKRYSLKMIFFIAVLTPTLFMIITLFILDINIYSQFNRQDHIRQTLIPMARHLNNLENSVIKTSNFLFKSIITTTPIKESNWQELWQTSIFKELAIIKEKNKYNIITPSILKYLENELKKMHSTAWWILESKNPNTQYNYLNKYQSNLNIKKNKILEALSHIKNNTLRDNIIEKLKLLPIASQLYIVSQKNAHLLAYQNIITSIKSVIEEEGCNSITKTDYCQQLNKISTLLDEYQVHSKKMMREFINKEQSATSNLIINKFAPLNNNILEIIKNIKIQISEKENATLIKLKGDEINILYALTATAILTILLALVFIYILKENIIDPLIRFRSAIETKRKTGKIEPVEVDNNNEIGELAHAFNNLLETQKLQEDTITTQNKELLKRSRFDMLTELPNAEYFKEYLTYQINVAQEHDSALGLIIIELRDIKQDKFSTNSITKFANLLKRSLSKKIFCARYSENKFAIVVTDIEKSHEVLFFFKEVTFVMKNVSSQKEKYLLNHFTAGISTYPKDGNNYETLVKNAIIALEKTIKSPTGEKISLYDVNVDAKYKKGSQLYEFLLTENPVDFLSVLYQPLFSLKTNEIVSVEALLRLEHPEYKSLNALEVVNLLEKMDKISEVDYWVIDKTMGYVEKNANKLQDAKFQISFNLSISDLNNRYFDLICQKASKSAVKNITSKIEITETQFFESYEDIKEKIYMLSQLHIPISIDDFGTGYASFSRLLLPNIKEVKIDKSFIKDITVNSSSKKIIKMIIDLAHNLNLQVVAEGVESSDQVEELKQLNCDIGQGFYYSNAVTFDELVKLVQKYSH